MKNHCVSLELAKLMDKAGWKKETEFYWGLKVPGKINPTPTLYSKEIASIYIKNKVGEFYSAPLATEILEEFKREKVYIDFGQMRFDEIENYWVRKNNIVMTDVIFDDALAKMWLYLREKKEV